MELVDLLELMGGVVYLEEEAVLAADVDSLDLGALLEGVGIVVGILEVEDCEDGVSGVMVEDDGGTREVLVLHPPESNVFLPARDQFIGVDRAELNGEDIEVTDLLGQQFGLSFRFDLTDIEDKYGLSFIRIESHHGEMLLVTESNLLHLFVGALEARDAFMINPYPH